LGTSDPFASISLTNVSKASDQKARRTKHRKHTVYPLWDEAFTLRVSSSDIKEGVLRLEIYDHDTFGTSDLIGRRDIELKDIRLGIYKRWYKLSDPSKKSPVAGHVFLVLHLTDQDLKTKSSNKNKMEVLPLQSDGEMKCDDTSVFCGTFNCGNAAPPTSLGDWIRRGHDIVAIGLQECTYKSKSSDSAHKEWSAAVLEYLNDTPDHNYLCLESHRLMEIQLFIFIREPCLETVSNLTKSTEATGIGNVVGNKGGVAISFEFGGTSLCFVNSHLAAHQIHKERRDADYSEICAGVSVGTPKQSLLSQFHHVWWMGDLNYRIDYGGQNTNSPSDDVFNKMIKMISAKEYEALKKFDQLDSSRAKEKAFVNFQEAEIAFQPTFKVYPGEPLNYQVKRSPAWCDRVLWRSAFGFEGDMRCLRYGNALSIQTSDHKPVFAEYVVKTWERPHGICDKSPPVSLVFEFVKGEHLIAADLISEESDPYLHFPRQPCLVKYVQSKHINKNVNPHWDTRKLPQLTIIRNNPTYLEKALLFLQVRDYDRFNADDKIGFCSLPLREALRNANKATKFKVPLSHKGLPAGKLSGRFTLKFHNR